jgi:hypothetical protein
MPEKDRRTDNWGGYHDYNRDPRQYHFPNSTRDLGWGEYQPQFDGHKKPTESINWWIVGFFVVLFLLLHNIGVF